VCTILLRYQPGGAEPVVLAANRDEYRARAADDPLVIAPGVFAGRDRTAGGTWLAVRAGAIAAITNIGGAERRPDARSRGELPLLALAGRLPRDYADYNAFNLLVVDEDGARVVTHTADGRPATEVRLGPGDHAIVNEPFGAASCPRGRAARALLEHGAPGFDLLTTHEDGGPTGLCHHGDAYGTVSSTVIALDGAGRVARYLHRPGQPCRAPTLDLTDAARAATAP